MRFGPEMVRNFLSTLRSKKIVCFAELTHYMSHCFSWQRVCCTDLGSVNVLSFTLVLRARCLSVALVLYHGCLLRCDMHQRGRSGQEALRVNEFARAPHTTPVRALVSETALLRAQNGEPKAFALCWPFCPLEVE